MAISVVRRIFSLCAVSLVLALIGGWLAVESRTQAPVRASLTGAWTLNPELSDKQPEGGGAGGEGGRGGGMGRGGGFGGGMRGGGRAGTAGGRGTADAMARVRDAMRDVMTPPEHLTITQTDVMVVIVSGDGRTTRLSPDGKKIKDENTGMERKSWWDGAKLVSEISGLMPGTITETYAIDEKHHRLQITLQMEGGRGQQRQTSMNRVYDADVR